MTPRARTPLPPSGAYPVAPSDSLRFTDSIVYVGGAGDVSVVTADGQIVTFAAVPAGRRLPVLCRAVRATGTTATALVRCC